MRIVNTINNNLGKSVSFKTFSKEYYEYHQYNWANYFIKAKDGLYDLLPRYQNSQHALLNDLIDQFENIVKARTNELTGLIQHFTTGLYLNLLYDAGGQTALGKDIEDAMNYKAFRSSAKASWFCDKLNLKSCLYCNAQFALTVGKDGVKKKLLFQLDHFFNKNRYPFLSLTLGNLIPSCSTCNISKSKTSFNFSTHIHPYLDDCNSKFRFKLNEDNALEYLLNSRDEKLLKPELEIYDQRFREHARIFSIENIYAKHTDIVEELLLKSLYYNDSKKEELKRQFNSLHFDDSVLDRFILGNYSLDSEINKRPLAKLYRDIGQQLKIIK